MASWSSEQEARRYLDFCERAPGIFDTLDQPFLQSSRPNPSSLALRLARHGVRGQGRFALCFDLGRAGPLFPGPLLRQLFGRYATYCGSFPLMAAATLILVAHA